jgi:hypothetical protein
MSLQKQSSSAWWPRDTYTREQIIEQSRAVLGRKSAVIDEREDVFRLEALGMEWDIGVQVYTPMGEAGVATGADGKKVGIFLLHGGDADFKSMATFARLFSEKFNFKVATMTFPGRLYLDDPSRDWPGDTIKADGTVRTPIWLKGEYVTPDQYDVIKDTSKRAKYATRTTARAKPGTLFYYRMAALPIAFEEGMKCACQRHFPENEFSIYVHGHSTGGPYVSMLSQRVANIAGAIAIENSTFGYVNERKHQWSGGTGKIEGYERPSPSTNEAWKDPFNDLYIRTWRDIARYRGPEALGSEGPQALMRLPWLMEDILAEWDVEKRWPQFKAEYMVTHNIVGSLKKAARVSAERLKMSETDTTSLVKHYLNLARELRGPGVKPVPPFLFGISKDSPDHSPEVYRDVILPMFREMDPAPRVAVTRFMAGGHFYTKSEGDLPIGISPAVAEFYSEAIKNGFFVV